MDSLTFTREEAEIIYNSLINEGVVFSNMYVLNCTFPIDLLKKIKRVIVTNSRLDNLDFLTCLPNLEELFISNLNYQKVSDYVDYSDSNFNIIGDYSAIGKLHHLKKLVIDNEVYVSELDFSNLHQLNTLVLTNNPSLRSLKGMGNLHKLDTVIMCGNHIREFDEFERYLHNTIDSTTNIIDLDVLFTHVKSIEDMNMLYNLYVKGLIHISFSEKNGQIGHFDMDIPFIMELYKKVLTMFKRAKLLDNGVSKEEQIDYIYNFVTSNIKFAEDELIQREKLYTDEVVPRYGKIPAFYDRHFGSLHCSYYAYHFRNANCEGMVNLMKFMSNVLGIDCEDVHCSDKKGFSTVLNHAIYRTLYNGVWTYFDPAYRVNTRGKDKKDSIGNFGRLSYDDVASYLNLSRFEKEISYKSYRDKILKLLDHLDDEENIIKLYEFIDWLYDENILKEPIDSLIESSFNSDLSEKIIQHRKEMQDRNVKKHND